ncbi:MAG: hypothetical protein Q9221_000694 [Calogaya cf. arnoldii]
MPPVIPSSLPIIHGSQRRIRPLSVRCVQGRAGRQLSKRARIGATAQVEGPRETPAITEGETTQHPEQPRDTVDTANLHPRVEQRAGVSAATTTNAAGMAHSAMNAFHSTERRPGKPAKLPFHLRPASGEESPTYRIKMNTKSWRWLQLVVNPKRMSTFERLERAKIAEKEAQAVLDRAQDAEKEAEIDCACASLLYESAKAETAHARDMVQRKLARQRGHRDGHAEETDNDNDSDTSE